jgi:hypothetical protein
MSGSRTGGASQALPPLRAGTLAAISIAAAFIFYLCF